MKQRFSSLDVKVIAHELQVSLVSSRLANVYDLSSKILLLKFAKPDDKKQLIIDTGFRCHLTDFARTTAAAPSAFVAGLRKSLKTRRLTSVAQVGTDRILEFQFSDGQYRLFVEFFASGNIILTDPDLKILAISRNVTEGDKQEPQRVGLQYSLENRQNFFGIPPLTKERIKAALETAVEKAEANAAASAKPGKKLKGKPGGDLRKGLAVSITELPPVLVEHILQVNSFDVTTKPAEILASEVLLDELAKCLSEARNVVENITSSTVCTGYIFAKHRPGVVIDMGGMPSTKKRDDMLYEDFHPFLPYKLGDDPSVEVLEFKGFNRAVDEFFSSLEGQKLESRLLGREEAAKRKLETARQDQAKRIEGLQDSQAMNYRKAAAIEANVERVQEAMDAVNGLLAQGMDWVDIGKLVEREKKRSNPVADIINLPLKLSENIITLTIAEEEFDDVNDEQDDPFETDDSDSEDERTVTTPQRENQSNNRLTVDIILNISPWGNAREYHEQRRSAAIKESKTQLQAAKALKSTEHKITEDLKKGLKQEKALLQPIRKQMWFEKFTWFVSSDGYLVIGGKDSHQNEMLYKKYLRNGDIYCHADLHGASSVVIRNNPSTPDAPIPPATLSQAGTLSVCSSEAWDSKAGMGAWWVNADQVSKSAPSGEYLPAGSFMIKGEKNFLPPTQLILGLGIIFKISEESKAKHVKHRLYDEDSAVGIDATDDQRRKDTEMDADGGENSGMEADNPEQAYSGDGSGAESDDNRPDSEKRANPLQSFGHGYQASANVEIELSGLEVTDQTASEVAISENAKASEKEGEENEGQKDKDDGGEDGEEEEPVNQGSPQPVTEASETPTKASHISSSTPGVSALGNKRQPKRGQKGKARRAAQKYKNQDEEDRAAAEALIGAKAGQQRAEAEAAVKAQRQAELEATKERRRAQHQLKQKEETEQEEIRRVMMDEGVDVLEADEVERMTALDALVGTPLPGDEIIEAIPVSAPWSALGRLKYKAKLQPGAMKKGKAVKEILERWKADSGRKGAMDESARDTERMWPREIELIKAFKPEEIINCVPVGKMRVMLGGVGGGGGGGSGGKGRGGGGGQKGQGKADKGGKGPNR